METWTEGAAVLDLRTLRRACDTGIKEEAQANECRHITSSPTVQQRHPHVRDIVSIVQDVDQ